MNRPVQTVATQSADAAVQLEREMADVLRRAFAQNEQLLGLLSRVVVEGMRATLGGQELRIPSPDKTARNAEIRAKYTGANVRKLAREYDLSVSSVYKIVQKKRGIARL
jgi:Mor family transcriptional regulator